MAAGVEAAAEVAATEIKMEEESGAPGVPSGNGAPGPKGEGERPAQNEKRKEKNIKRGGNRFEPYANPTKRYRAFITNIPFDVKWQSLKDLVKEKVGEVTYVELLMDAEGKSRGCAVVEFKMEESMKKAAEVLNKHSLSGRPLKVKEDPDGEHARRAMQKVMATTGGMGMGPGGPGMITIPPSILNNPNIPNEIIHALQAGRLGSTVFVANLDYKVGWKKLKEVFSMAGVVVRADILEDKDGKSRGIGTVTFEQSIEAVQAISMFNGQLLFDRPMHVKMDERALPKGDFFPPERPQQLPHGLGGIGMGLGPGGQPIDANHLNKGIGMGNIGPAGMGMEGIGFGINKMGGMEGPFGGGMENMGRFGSGMNMGRINEILSNALKRGEIIAKQGGGGGGGSVPGIERMGPGIDRLGGAGMERMGAGLGHGMDRVGSEIERMGLVMDRMGSVERMGSGIERMGPLGLDHMASSIERMGQTMERIGSGVERMGAGMGFGLERMAAPIDRVGQTIERMGSGVERMGPAIERMGLSMERMVPAGMGAGLERMGPVMDRMATGLERMGANNLERMGLERMGANSLERMGLERMGANSLERMGPAMGPALGAGIERMGLAMGGGGGASFDRAIEMERGNFGGSFAGSFGGAGGHAPGVARKACQIFVRNLPFDFTWKMLKDKFNECGHVLYADIKMENGKSKGCGVVKFESPEVAERACRMMNGMKLSGREIDVRIDRNA
ncbi:heterogeneous nuclear ribonucleoprotein M isoform X6 [Macaca nemestrina]|uniref:Heterogeneous nuclear ribonucleoprotein M n=15 Tax=Simiiformes TaxID=314293 RepID=HNRPM_HUMAN|nr:heterogeneous nuclear ribonucleoprotein M isoform a [Homo sapiens]XP_001159326.2 heterogeneous nuclear ribonucleoprotein M isoform X6 [Pan troglodytes]XP_003810023.1 heterogeneous nuclear ribonucleoprotein M isoform X5 [Pan paniscus]XP_005587892.1 heterogeneous nuclear ribonucleoprotein M isoform X1 [Macaca fascicularis]XP_009191641.2 heterogeneous nuclear ribonucleoprotein M isoform X1 [Papio anubis]XP_011740882.1 heterogeneous nuclear ribonucleoprotein M isoform X1 [Macaca nemestrina]XP_|eukprot:NP_005959.2 heterogeneous nuclear ribonucleoprotein M isoform a [Homo sapiens]